METVQLFRLCAESKAQTRMHYAPDPYEDGAGLRVCKQCGGEYWDWKSERRRSCIPCSLAREVSNNAQQSRKHGPDYERAVLAQLKFWAGEAERLGITPQGER